MDRLVEKLARILFYLTPKLWNRWKRLVRGFLILQLLKLLSLLIITNTKGIFDDINIQFYWDRNIVIPWMYMEYVYVFVFTRYMALVVTNYL